MHPQTHGQLIFDKTGKNIQWNKDSLFSKWCWENWATGRRMNLDYFLTPDTKINSKWMKGLNVRQKTIKIFEEKAGKNLFDLGHSNFLLSISPEARETKAKMNYCDQNKKLLQLSSMRILPAFSSKILMASCLTLRSLIQCEFIFVYGVRKWSRFILL